MTTNHTHPLDRKAVEAYPPKAPTFEQGKDAVKEKMAEALKLSLQSLFYECGSSKVRAVVDAALAAYEAEQKGAEG